MLIKYLFFLLENEILVIIKLEKIKKKLETLKLKFSNSKIE